MKRQEFRELNFWIELRKRTCVNGRIGIEECYYWCTDALKLLSQYRRPKFILIGGSVSPESKRRYDLFVNSHKILARKYSDRIFIADGTAGQIDRNYPLGYYDYIQNASETLRLFYDSAIDCNWKDPNSEWEKAIDNLRKEIVLTSIISSSIY